MNDEKPIVTDDSKSITDSEALRARIGTYAKLATRDINDVLSESFSSIDPNQALKVLDVGCGVGNQSLRLAQMFPKCEILAIDVSQESIQSLRNSAAAGGHKNISAQVVDFNDFSKLKRVVLGFTGQYDLIVSFFAIYYSRNMVRNLRFLMDCLKPHGKMVLVGYSRHNNRELVEISQKYANRRFATNDFITDRQISRCFGDSASVERSNFYNELNFNSVEDFSKYYANYGLYLKEIEADVVSDVEKEIKKKGVFQLTKVSLVLLIEKGSSSLHAEADQPVSGSVPSGRSY